MKAIIPPLFMFNLSVPPGLVGQKWEEVKASKILLSEHALAAANHGDCNIGVMTSSCKFSLSLVAS